MTIYRIEYHSDNDGMLWASNYYLSAEKAWEGASDNNPRTDQTVPLNMSEGFGVYTATLIQ
jgi:hypothetical protein